MGTYGFNEGDRARVPVYSTADTEVQRAYETVTDMQDDTTLTAGMIVRTLGFHSAGDGGGALYTISSTGTANGMDVIALDNGLLAHLQIINAYITFEMYGGIGDGATDNLAIWNNLVRKNIDGVTCIFPAGNFVFSNTVLVPDNFHIVGSGINTVFEFKNGNNQNNYWGCVVSLIGSNTSIENIKITYPDENRDFGLHENFGCIGISGQDFETAVTDSNTSPKNIENIIVKDIYTDSSYAVQTEPANGYTIKNVTYANVNAPNGVISVTHTTDFAVDNVQILNCKCGFIRSSLGYACNMLIDGIEAEYGRLTGHCITLVNSMFKAIEDSYASSFTYTADINYCVGIGRKCVMSNCVVDANNLKDVALNKATDTTQIVSTLIDNVEAKNAILNNISVVDACALIANCIFSTYTSATYTGAHPRGKCINCDFGMLEDTNAAITSDTVASDCFNSYLNSWQSLSAQHFPVTCVKQNNLVIVQGVIANTTLAANINTSKCIKLQASAKPKAARSSIAFGFDYSTLNTTIPINVTLGTDGEIELHTNLGNFNTTQRVVLNCVFPLY